MSILVLDQATIGQFKVVIGDAEVRDENGTLIGFFHSAVSPENVDQYECPLSEEELLRRSKEDGGRPLKDILRDMENHS